MFKLNSKPGTTIIGLMVISIFATAFSATATTTAFQTNDSHRVLDPSVQTNSPTVTRIESVSPSVHTFVVVSPKPIKLKPAPSRTAHRATRSRRLAPKAVDYSKYPYYARPHAIFHGTNCPAGPQWVVDLAHDMVSAKFGESQWQYAKRLWTKESNFNPWCENSAGAYGVPQAYPGSKMGGNWRYDVRHQIEWGDSYIAAKYGTPEAAMAHSRRYNSY
ncbi:MAG: hypothetical protein ABIS59_02020 [Candidatus Saccharibacteria bacterium]